MTRLVVIGAGGHAKVVAEAALASGSFEVTRFLDDHPSQYGNQLLGLPVTGPIELESFQEMEAAACAVGDNKVRRRLVKRLGCAVAWATVVHPAAWVSPSAKIGPGSVVMAGSVMQADSIVGVHVILNTGCSVDHDCRVGAYSHIGPGVRLSGGVDIGEGVLLGVGSAVAPGVKIGDCVTIGAGAAVVADCEAGLTYVGVPARPLGKLQPK